MQVAIYPEQWQALGSYFRFKNHQVFYRTSGNPATKPTILLLHGFPTASWDWQGVWPALESQFHLLALDFLGLGFSDKPRGHRYSIMEQADITEALLESLNIGPHHILAHDYGDTVAQELLARDNSRSPQDQQILSCCLLNGGLFPETHLARPMQKLLAGKLGPLLSRLSSRGIFERNMRAIFGPETQPSKRELAAFWFLLTRNKGKLAIPALLQYMTDRRTHRERWLQALQDYTGPIALINGSIDPVSGAHMVIRFEELVGRGVIFELERLGHYPHTEDPDQIAKLYLDFLHHLRHASATA